MLVSRGAQNLQLIQEIRDRGLLPQSTKIYLLCLFHAHTEPQMEIAHESKTFLWKELFLSKRILMRKLLHRGTPKHLGNLPASEMVSTGPFCLILQTYYTDQTPSWAHWLLPVSLTLSASFPLFPSV